MSRDKINSLAQTMSLEITDLKHDVLLSIRINRNQLPHVVKSLSEITPDVLANQFNNSEVTEAAGVVPLNPNKPYHVFMIDDKKYLTPSENRIMERLSLGRSNKEIAADLNLKECTVKNNLQRIFRKFGINYRSEAILKHQKCKIINNQIQ
jgi:DNA-binding NarL/FixJ family response regulator